MAAARNCVVVAAFASFLASPIGAQEAPVQDVVSVLSYNVNGLFRLAAAGNPGARSKTIGWLANKYDVVLFQEDFEYHDDLTAQMVDKVGLRGNGVGTDPRRLVPKILLAPFALLIPHFWPPYGSGVSTFVPAAMAIDGDVDRVPYGVCDQWLGGTWDCWAAKGFLRVGARLPNGAEIDFYNTHLEAGPKPESVAMRREQLALLAQAIESSARNRAVIVGGDFNIGYNRPGDRDVSVQFRERLGLTDSGAGPELPFWRERDYVLYRDGTETVLSVEDAGEATEFVNGHRALSDHPAIYARFRAVSTKQETAP